MARPQILIRRAEAGEAGAVKTLVGDVIDEIYGHLWDIPPFTLDNEDWSRALVADAGGKIRGIALTKHALVSDLWLRPPFRSQGVGAALLAAAEAEIADRGHRQGALRVVETNRRALAFYERHGWRVVRRFPHETLPIMLLHMVKTLVPER